MLDNKFVPQINLTMRCNMYNYCTYCYVKNVEKEMKDIDIPDFAQLLAWLKEIGVDELILLGGEPVMHPKFKEFAALLEKNDIHARLFTNGMYKQDIADLVNASPYLNTMFFHYDEKYAVNETLRNRFAENLSSAHAANKKLWLRFNISEPNQNFDELIDLASKYQASIGYSISVPSKESGKIQIADVHGYADCLIALTKKAKDAGLELEPGRAMPLCAFTPEQLSYLMDQAHLQGNCIAINDFTINTDLSLQLCSITHNLKLPKATSVDDLKVKIEQLKREEEKLSKIPAIPACIDCDYFASGECQGGCYAYKLHGDTAPMGSQAVQAL